MREADRELFTGMDGCVLLFDVTTARTFENVASWREEFLERAGMKADDSEAVAEFPFILIGNKIDLVELRLVDPRDVVSWCADNHDIPYFEVSAKDDVNVVQPFKYLAKQVLKQKV